MLLAACQQCSSMCHFLECSIYLPAGDMGWYCIRASLWAYGFDKPLSVSAHAGGCPKGYASTWLLCHRLVCPVAAWQPALHCLVRLRLLPVSHAWQTWQRPSQSSTCNSRTAACAGSAPAGQKSHTCWLRSVVLLAFGGVSLDSAGLFCA